MTDKRPPTPGSSGPPGLPEENRAHGAILAHVRNELYSPINAIVAYTGMLVEEARQRTCRDIQPDLEKIEEAGRRMLRLAGELLDPEHIAARSADEDLQNYGSWVRHELRTPLNAIIGYSEMLLEDLQESEASWLGEDLGKVNALGRRLLALTEDIVRFSQGLSDVDQTRSEDQAAAMAQAAFAALHPAETEATPALPAERGRILVVDDNEINRDLVSRQLVREGHQVEAAENGRAALERIVEESFDLVLLDIMMPELNGYQVLEVLKREDRLRDLPVIMISALDEIESVIRCIEMGAEDYLPKPFNQILLRARINACLEKKRLREARIAMIRAEEERLRREVEMAALVQQQLFPKCAPKVNGIDVSGICHPAREVGGDYYDFVQLDGDRLGIAIADVAGKGMPAALLMSAVQASLRSRLPLSGANAADMVGDLNELLLRWIDAGRYATFFYVEFNPATPHFTYVNAGHNPPVFRSAATGAVRSLATGGLFLGGFPGLSYDEETFAVESGDILVAFTDGITEAQTSEGEEYGETRLLAVIEAGCELPAEALRESIIADVRAYCGDAPQYDDMTLVVVKAV